MSNADTDNRKEDTDTIDYVARQLTYYLIYLREKKRNKGRARGVGRREVRRRAVHLLHYCYYNELPPPSELVRLINWCLAVPPSAGREGDGRSPEWKRAVQHEARTRRDARQGGRESNPEANSVYAASVRETAIAAFGTDDGRKSIRDWRKTFRYYDEVIRTEYGVPPAVAREFSIQFYLDDLPVAFLEWDAPELD